MTEEIMKDLRGYGLGKRIVTIEKIRQDNITARIREI